MAAKKQAEKKKQNEAFKYVLRYPKKECKGMFFGIICLVLGAVGDFVVPMYIGWVIDQIELGDLDKVRELCIQLVILVLVSLSLRGNLFRFPAFSQE